MTVVYLINVHCNNVDVTIGRLLSYGFIIVPKIQLVGADPRHLYFCREYRDHVKDLSCISQDLCRVVIVDNNPFSFLLQPLNGIPCVPFSAGQPHDDQVKVTILE